jgi:8-oxo-dGTP pyrophosphatase MutT (NUDIX family)
MNDGGLPERRMIRIAEETRLFSFRVAGLLIQNDHILVQRAVGDDFWALPGGRAEIGETSEQTLIREMQEEISRDITISRLLFSVESFFEWRGKSVHEFSLIYLIAANMPFPFHPSDIVHRIHDGVDVEFRWIAASKEAMTEAKVVPDFLAEHIGRLPESSLHVIRHDPT